MDRRANELNTLHDDALKKLQEISNMTNDEARAVLMQEVEKEAQGDMARIKDLRLSGRIKPYPLIAHSVFRPSLLKRLGAT